MNKIQINHIRVDKDILKEIKKHMIPLWQKDMLLGTMVVALFVSFMTWIAKDYVQSLVLFALASLCVGEVFWLSHQKVKKILKTMSEETKKDYNIYVLIFGSDDLVIRNSDMKTDNKLPYDNIKRIVETENTYTLFGKSSEFAIVRKDCLKISRNQFLDFLKSKETKIRRWPQEKNEMK